MDVDKLKKALAEYELAGEPLSREVVNDLLKAITDLKDCRNELCLKCGRYHEKHLGACNGCRWDW